MKALNICSLFLVTGIFISFYSDAVHHKKHPENIFAPDEWIFLQRSFPYGKIDETAQMKAIQQVVEGKKIQKNKNPRYEWEFVGPVNLGGRITDIEVPSGSENTVYAAAASGGIFKSFDRGNTWFPIFDGQTAIAVGDIAISPSDTNVIYAGTGEPNAGGGSLAYDGSGIFKSADGGQTWQNLGLTESGSTGRIALDPSNPALIFVAVMGKLFANNPERGIFRSTDGGNSWQKVLFVSDSTGGIDVVLNPSNPNIIYASLWERIRRPNRRVYGGPTSAIYKSTDGGTTWNKLVNGLPVQQLGRISLALSAGNPAIIYASIVGKNEQLIDVYKSTDSGDHWVALNAVSQIYTTSYDWWFGGVKVDPVNPNEVYLLMMYPYRSLTGGTANSWAGIASGAHVDQHALYLSPTNPQYRILGNDGGVNFTSDNFLTITGTDQQNLPIGQFYSVDVFAGGSAPNYVAGGLQDNGVAEKSDVPPQEWQLVIGGDGVLSKFDPGDPQTFYGSTQYGGFEFSNPVNGYYFPSGFNAGDRFNWKSPMTIYKKHSSMVFIGSNRVYRSMNYGYTVEPISSDLSNGPGISGVVYGTVTALAVAPSDSETIYAGTDDANLWSTQNGGLSWSKINTGLPQRWVTSVKVAAGNPLEVFVTFSGYRFNDSIAHVYHSLDGGLSWTSISGNLPDIPVNDLFQDPEYPGILYLATDVGVYYSIDTGLDWQLLGSALPLVPVNELAMYAASHYLYAATYGRSMYRINISDITGIKEVQTAKLNLSIFPNPVQGEFHLQFMIINDQPAILSVYNLQGTLLKTENLGNLNRGVNNIRILPADQGGNQLPAGCYIFRLVNGNAEGLAKGVVL
jgi:photosystem II stability/assembly factor-like uncharacterized protein